MTMLKVSRFAMGEKSTLGLLSIDGDFECFTLEDIHRDVKVPGETRIAAGHYMVRTRTWGRFWESYRERWNWHRGVFEVCDVPGFTDVLVHTGNSHEHTAGCLLVGMGAEYYPVEGGRLTHSRNAYAAMYPKIIDAAEAGDLELIISDDH